MFSLLSASSSLMSYPIEENSYSFELEQEITHEFEVSLKANPQEVPVLILIGGFQGSGKSTLVSRIKEIYDINVVSTDSIRQSLFERGLKVSPEFSKCVNNISNNLIRKSLETRSNLLLDANSHSKRIAEMEKLLRENNPHYITTKIFLNASMETLRDRVKNRKPILGSYQGTESDLEAALSLIKIDFDEYDLIVDTDNLSQSDVFEEADDLISLYFKHQLPNN